MLKNTSDSLFANKHIVPKEFNRVARRYDFATLMSQGYQEDLNRSADLLVLKGDETVIDLCCGTGKSTRALLPKITSGKIICVDNSEGMLAVLHEKFLNQIEKKTIVTSLQDAMRLDFEENSIDAIFMAYGLRNMSDYGRCVANLYKILKPGGQLVIHDYSLSNNSFSRIYWKVLGYGFIVPFCTLVSGSSAIYSYLVKSVIKFLNPSEIKSLLEQNGFKNVTIHDQPSWRKPVLHSFHAIKE